MHSPNWLEVAVTTAEDGVQVVYLSGDLDMATAPQFSDVLTATIESGFAAIVIDLGALSFLDAAGLNALLHARRHAQRAARALRVRNPHGEVDTILRITAVADLLQVSDIPSTDAEPHPVTRNHR